MTSDTSGDTGPPDFVSEIEHGHDAYTEAELLEQCQANAQALLLAVFVTAMEDEAHLTRLVDGVGSRLAGIWDANRIWEAAEVLDALLTNLMSLGGEVESVDLAATSPHATLSGLPRTDLAAMMDVPAGTLRPMLGICERIAARLGWQLVWSHDTSGRVTLHVTEPS